MARLAARPTVQAPPVTLEDHRKLLIELSVHQAELEIQNEELMRSQGALEDANERFVDLYDFAPIGYFTVDRSGTLRGGNLRGARLFGADRETLPGRQLDGFFPSEARLDLAAFLAAVHLGKQPAPFELPAVGAGERPLWLRIEGVRSEFGAECRLAVSDVTEQRRVATEAAAVEGQLRQAQKIESIALLVGGVAHDLNNILTPIVAHAELALEGLPPGATAGDDLGQIRLAAGRAADLVQRLLVIGRKQAPGEPAPVSLGPLVKETLKFLRATLPATIELSARVDPTCGPVLADLSEVHQVILNLCTNAAYAMKKSGGVLSVAVERGGTALGGPTVRLLVSDTGGGIPEALLDRIFEPYFTTKPVGQGSGLGLAVVRGIVRDLHGEIHVRSREGEGTTFEVLLPELRTASAPAAAGESSVPRGAGEHVLVVDDEPAIVRVVTRILTALGYRATGVSGGAAALAAFEADRTGFDVLFTDFTMPRVTGLGLIDQLRLHRPGLPIVLATGHADGVDRHVAAEHGVAAFITKPFTTRLVAEAVHKALGEKR